MIPSHKIASILIVLVSFSFSFSQNKEAQFIQQLESSSDFDAADCTNHPGVQLVNDSFNSGGATLSDDDINDLSGISIYPNPTKDVISINSLHDELTRVEVFNLNGQLLSTRQDHVEQLEVSDMAAGVYFLKLHTNKGHKTLKFIKQ